MMEELKDKTGEEIIQLADEYAHEEALRTIVKNLEAAAEMVRKMKNVAIDDKNHIVERRISGEAQNLTLDTSKQAWLAAFRLSHICDDLQNLLDNYF